jgi:flagellar basal body-associated protein FliL
MADKKNDAKTDEKQDGAEAPKRKGGMKFALITVALLAIEGGVLFAVFSLGGPKDAQATHAETANAADPGDDPCEVAVFNGPLFNDRTGINYGFKVEVFVSTKARHRDAITKKIEDSKAALRAEIAGIWRMASSDDLADPLFESLRRRIEAKLMERLNPRDGDSAGGHAAPAPESAGDHAKSAEPPAITGAVVISTPAVRQER